MERINPERLRQARLDRGITQAQMARGLRTHERQIVRWERGESQPRPHVRQSLADYLGVPIETLAGDDCSTPHASGKRRG